MIEDLKKLIGKLSIFAKDRIGFQHPPKLFLKQDQENGQKLLGRTAHYDPKNQSITLYTTSRHPKDILRSFAHELVHHTQNLRGDLKPEKMGSMGKNYAQDNEHMRNMEKEAYLVGNLCFRDFEDRLGDEDKKLYKLTESKFLKENRTMTTKITKEFLKEKIVETLNKMINEDKTLQFSDGEKSAVRNAPNKRSAQLTAQKLLQRKGLQGSDALKAVGQIVRAFYDEKTMDPSTGLSQAKDGLDKSAIAKKVKNNTLLKFLNKDDQEDNFDAAAMADKFKGAISMKDIPAAKPSDPFNKKRIAGVDKSFNMKGVNPDLDRARDEYERLLDKYQVAPVQRESAESELEETAKEQSKKKFAANQKPFDKATAKDRKGAAPDSPNNKSNAREKKDESKIQTPEEENTLYEQRFTPKNTKLYEKLLKEWTK